MGSILQLRGHDELLCLGIRLLLRLAVFAEDKLTVLSNLSLAQALINWRAQQGLASNGNIWSFKIFGGSIRPSSRYTADALPI